MRRNFQGCSRILLLFCLLAMLSRCSGLIATPIAKLHQNPRDYEDKQVTIAGRVTSRNSLVVLKYFTVQDDSGEIAVITKRALPGVGQKVRVKGKLQEGFSLGQEQSVVLVESGPE